LIVMEIAGEGRGTGGLYERTFQTIDHPVFVIADDGRIVVANRATGELFGQDAAELAGRRCHEVFHGRTDFIDECPFRRACRSGRRERTVVHLGPRWFVAAIEPLETGGAVHTLLEITRLRETEAMLTGFLTDAVLRLARPTGVIAETLSSLADDLESGRLTPEEVALALRCEAAGARGLTATINALKNSVAGEMHELPEDYRRFLLQ
jgi:PAS domain S-box-containing protein